MAQGSRLLFTLFLGLRFPNGSLIPFFGVLGSL